MRPHLAASTVSAAVLLATVDVAAQAPARGAERPRAVGQPARVATFEALAEVRAFAVARAGDRALVAYVAGGADARGALRLAHVRGQSGALERVGTDRALAPAATAVAVAWDGTSGAVAYVTQRPHRGEENRPRRRRPIQPAPGADDHSPALENPLGASALTAGDVMLQRVDAAGAPVGRAVTVFQENSRAFRVAVVRDGDGWLVAWTGAVTADEEVRGTVRTSRVDANGVARAAASDTGFTGEVGDALALVPRANARASALVVWTGERCGAREGQRPHPPLEGDPSADVERRQRALNPQAPPREHGGPPIACSPPMAFSAELRVDGTTGPVVEGPAVLHDALALVRGAQGATAVAALGTARGAATLSALPLDAQGRVGRARVVAAGATTTGAQSGAAARPPTASTVPPPPAPGADDIARAPAALDAVLEGGTLTFAAVSPTHNRVVYGTQPAAGGAASLTQIAPAARTFGVALASAPGAAPWLFAHTGSAWSGPLVWVDGATVGTHATTTEVPWPGDEQLRAHVVRAVAARAEYTRTMASYGPVAVRTPDSPNLPAMLSMVRSRRARWEAACGPLNERARWLSRHGVGPDVLDLARELCELPSDPPNVTDPSDRPSEAVPAAPGAPPAAR